MVTTKPEYYARAKVEQAIVRALKRLCAALRAPEIGVIHAQITAAAMDLGDAMWRPDSSDFETPED